LAKLELRKPEVKGTTVAINTYKGAEALLLH
jgi:hypothetical protein